MSVLEFEIISDGSAGKEPGGTLSFPVRKVLNGGFSGRNQEKVRAHIEELAHLGVEDPGETPTFYPLVSTVVTQAETIEVVTDTGNWGEAEPVLLFQGDEIYVTVGSDHTDRSLEGASILKSKQVYPNVVGRQAWALTGVRERWDDVALKAWVGRDREELFQEGRLGDLLPPEKMIEKARAIVDGGDLEGTVFFLGTIAALSTIDFHREFECELRDEETGRAITCRYESRPLSWFKGW